VVALFDLLRERSLQLAQTAAPALRNKIVVEADLQGALRRHRLIIDATPAGGIIPEELVFPDTCLAARQTSARSPANRGRDHDHGGSRIMTERSREEHHKDKSPPARYYRKRVELFRLIEKIKLWPSRRGILHGIASMSVSGDQARIVTHCQKTFWVRNSRNSRAARWLRNKWFTGVCPVCAIPAWKLAKYSATRFSRRFGSNLEPPAEDAEDKD